MILKPIPNFPDYFASDDGDVYSMKPYHGDRKPTVPRKRKKGISPTGYYIVRLHKNGVGVTRKVAHLVLEAFVCMKPKGYYACHGVGGCLDDSIKNLRWGTPSENQRDRLRDGTHQYGIKNPAAKLNKLQVRIIHRLYEMGRDCGFTQKVIAQIFSTTQGYVSELLANKKRNHGY